jgi:hypothetical protein
MMGIPEFHGHIDHNIIRKVGCPDKRGNDECVALLL